MHYMHCFVEELESLLYMILCRKSVIFEGCGLQPPKNRGRPKKTEGWTAMKSVCLAVGSYQRAPPSPLAPPPLWAACHPPHDLF